MIVKISDLRMREVVNVIDGRRLGAIRDIDIDLDEGMIKAIIVPGESRMFSLFGSRTEDLYVPWERVRKIGIDVILVEVEAVRGPRGVYLGED
ncbi:MAG TPA: YlmC/YmxH family sporulation protein [Bacillota bacterium]|nr:YlmC/YmxH family sporulation protein [Bacillota bacterium]